MGKYVFYNLHFKMGKIHRWTECSHKEMTWLSAIYNMAEQVDPIFPRKNMEKS